jgi:hypothetical protein
MPWNPGGSQAATSFSGKASSGMESVKAMFTP